MPLVNPAPMNRAKPEGRSIVPVTSIRELLEAGVHFGHESKRWNPKMKRFIFEERNGIHIIDLHQTQEQMEEAYAFVRECVASGKAVLFVGTKRQAKEPIKEAAIRAGMPCVTERWLGGLLTNIKTVRKSIGRYRELQRLVDEGVIARLPKKEVASIRREMAKLERNLAGIIEMTELPGALFVIDPKKERIAVAEANRLGIPIVALVDTNCDPEEIDYPIVSNDDAIRAIALFAERISQACVEGMKLRQKAEGEEAGEKAPAASREEKAAVHVVEEVPLEAEPAPAVAGAPEKDASAPSQAVAPADQGPISSVDEDELEGEE